VFGAAIGSRITQIDGVNYGSFIVPGLIMLMLLTQSVTNASFGIYFPRFVGTIYELLSAPVSPFEIVLGYVGAAATKSLVLGTIILATSGLFVPIHIAHPVWMISFLVLTAVLAHGDAVQSAGLSDLGLPLELLRRRRRECRGERGDDAGVPGRLHGHRLVVLQDRVSAEELAAPFPSPFEARFARTSG
jgi:hypothetical protein